MTPEPLPSQDVLPTHTLSEEEKQNLALDENGQIVEEGAQPPVKEVVEQQAPSKLSRLRLLHR